MAGFSNPAWGCEVIVKNDEVDYEAGEIHSCSNEYDEGENDNGSRDMNHKSTKWVKE